ncbi:MAG: class I SAM-dependent methyltransferase [Cyanobacteria bacterium P01_A01_bin.83]
MTLYDSIGGNYNSTRKPDYRIVEQLVNLLNLPRGSTIADVGAGTGNYSYTIANLEYQVIAIEPSQVMQSQRQHHPLIRWITAVAEQIPLPDNAVDGVLIMLALHHFDEINLAIAEINRISRTGKIVIFAFEQSKIPDFWLTEYFPGFINDTLNTFPSTQELAQIINNITHHTVDIIPFLLPTDLSDLFAASGWCRPEIYLDSQVRHGISTFAKMSANELNSGLKKLKSDIDHGIWHQKYGHLLEQEYYDAGYRILVTR